MLLNLVYFTLIATKIRALLIFSHLIRLAPLYFSRTLESYLIKDLQLISPSTNVLTLKLSVFTVLKK